jgi:hypothetical protein
LLAVLAVVLTQLVVEVLVLELLVVELAEGRACIQPLEPQTLVAVAVVLTVMLGKVVLLAVAVR